MMDVLLVPYPLAHRERHWGSHPRSLEIKTSANSPARGGPAEDFTENLQMTSNVGFHSHGGTTIAG